ncbi:hypothetical protein AAHA92_17331 [Salvia divinorum]|uniref:Uncharacterized protein n=1 Tax=Salvia divinorum TaxID=28513 RepID=A0ABD1GYG1_SALDI
MEGLIPLVYKAIVQYRNGGQSGLTGAWLDDTQSAAAYTRLPGDSELLISRFSGKIMASPPPPQRGGPFPPQATTI